jgi:hypothetical protein
MKQIKATTVSPPSVPQDQEARGVLARLVFDVFG